MKFYLHSTNTNRYDKLYKEWKKLFESFKITKEKEYAFINFDTLSELINFVDCVKKDNKSQGIIIEKERIFNIDKYCYAIEIYDDYRE